MSLTELLIQEYEDHTEAENLAEKQAQQKEFDNWLAAKVKELKQTFKVVFGDDVEYHWDYMPNPKMIINVGYLPFIVIEGIAAEFSHNFLRTLLMSPDVNIPPDSPEFVDWKSNPLNEDVPRPTSVKTRAEVGKVLKQWEDANWDISPWPVKSEAKPCENPDEPTAAEVKPLPRYRCVFEKEINDLYHNGFEFKIVGTGWSEGYEDGFWHIEITKFGRGDAGNSL